MNPASVNIWHHRTFVPLLVLFEHSYWPVHGSPPSTHHLLTVRNYTQLTSLDTSCIFLKCPLARIPPPAHPWKRAFPWRNRLAPHSHLNLSGVWLQGILHSGRWQRVGLDWDYRNCFGDGCWVRYQPCGPCRTLVKITWTWTFPANQTVQDPDTPGFRGPRYPWL